MDTRNFFEPMEPIEPGIWLAFWWLLVLPLTPLADACEVPREKQRCRSGEVGKRKAGCIFMFSEYTLWWSKKRTWEVGSAIALSRLTLASTCFDHNYLQPIRWPTKSQLYTSSKHGNRGIAEVRCRQYPQKCHNNDGWVELGRVGTRPCVQTRTKYFKYPKLQVLHPIIISGSIPKNTHDFPNLLVILGQITIEFLKFGDKPIELMRFPVSPMKSNWNLST